jgi:O-methyltransferase
MSDTARGLYLDLLKKSLSDTLHGTEPDAEAGGSRFMVDFMRHYVRGRAVTMLPRARLDHLQACVEDVIARGVPGDVLEAGVWRGGAAILMRGVLKAHGVQDRVVWAADSFEGLPEPDAERFPREAAAFQGPVMRDALGHLAASLEDVQANFTRYGLLDAQVRFLRGWFHETLPAAPVGPLAVLRVDGDFHDSTRAVLDALYGKLSVGGWLIADDYGEDEWTYCRQAVDGFRAERGITEPLVRVDRGCSCWRRER